MSAVPGKRVLNVLYYYLPYTSGLTIYAARIADELVQRGWDICVVSTQYDSTLPEYEHLPSGVDVERVPIAGHFDRAVLAPLLIPRTVRAMRHVDIVQIHIPLVEAAPIALIARLMRKRVVVTHLSDLVLNTSRLTRFAAAVSRWSGIIAGRLAHSVVTLTESRARVSPTTRRLGANLTVIAPPIIAPDPPPDARESFRAEHAWGNRPIIGYVGRYTSEKGIEHLLKSIPILRDRFPDLLVALVGPMRDPRTGEVYRGPWDTPLADNRHAIQQLDVLSDEDLARFYAAIDVFVLPSIDWTETFGMVQVEAMLRGTPVVASDLPGVNDPITRTGYGLLAEPGNQTDLAEKVSTILDARAAFTPDITRVRQLYSLASTIDAYERIYLGGDPPP